MGPHRQNVLPLLVTRHLSNRGLINRPMAGGVLICIGISLIYIGESYWQLSRSLCNRGRRQKVGLVYWGLTPQQQPGPYQGGEMMMKSVFWWRKPEYPEETTDLRTAEGEGWDVYVRHGGIRLYIDTYT